MKRTLWRVTSCVLTLCLLAASLHYLTYVMERKGGKYQPFFEQEADFDVLFMGTSHVLDGVFPMELWNDYGIVSYNFGEGGNRIPTIYWVIENALDHTTPKLIVVDCLRLEMDEKTNSSSYSFVHGAMDAFPLSATKIRSTLDLLDDPVIAKGIEDGTIVEGEKRTPIGLLWDFSVYHSRWNELGQGDFQVTGTAEKGAQTVISVAVPQDVPKVDRSEKLEEDTVGVEYLKKIIEKCRERGIEILLTYLPFPADATDQKNANRVYDIAGEYGVNYINFLDMDIIDYDTDCFDSDSHLNPSGARKVTDYLGSYIMEHYRIPDRRSSPEYSGWFADYEAYEAIKANYLRSQRGWDTYLMLLADKSFDAVIEVRNPGLWNNDKFVSLAENLGINMPGASGAANYLMIRKGGIQAEAVSLDTAADARTDTVMGLLSVSHDGPGRYGVYLNGAACFPPDGDGGGDIRIYVRNSESLEPVGSAVF